MLERENMLELANNLYIEALELRNNMNEMNSDELKNEFLNGMDRLKAIATMVNVRAGDEKADKSELRQYFRTLDTVIFLMTQTAHDALKGGRR